VPTSNRGAGTDIYSTWLSWGVHEGYINVAPLGLFFHQPPHHHITTSPHYHITTSPHHQGRTTRGDAPGYINVAPLGLFAGATPLASQAPSVSIIKAWGNAQASALTRLLLSDIFWLFRLHDLGAIKCFEWFQIQL